MPPEKKQPHYDALITSAQSESGDTEKKVEDAIAAINIKPTQLEPYDALRTLYESDNEFTVDEEAKFQAVITPYKDDLSAKAGYSDFAYQVGTMYLIYYTESSESYIKAIDWFSAVTGDHKDAADVYLRIGQFDRDITKKLRTGDESGEFRTQWDSLNEALTLAGKQNNDLLLMAICKKVISAMDEYCVKFKKDGVTRDEMSETLDTVKADHQQHRQQAVQPPLLLLQLPSRFSSPLQQPDLLLLQDLPMQRHPVPASSDWQQPLQWPLPLPVQWSLHRKRLSFHCS